MKKFFLGIIFLVFYLSLNLSAKDTIKIRVTNWPPNYYKTKDGNWTGVDVELAKAIIKKAGFSTEFIELPWSRALIAIKLGEIDMMMNLSITSERSEYLHWLGPVRYDQRNLVVKKGNENLPIHSLDDMIKISKEKNIKFGYQNDVFYGNEFKKRIKEDSKLINVFESVTKSDFNLQKTKHGRILGFFESTTSIKYLLKTNSEYKNLAIHPYSIYNDILFFGISKKSIDSETLSALYEAYEKLLLDGTIEKIRKKWTP